MAVVPVWNIEFDCQLLNFDYCGSPSCSRAHVCCPEAVPMYAQNYQRSLELALIFPSPASVVSGLRSLRASDKSFKLVFS
jgi:hypothetical protein